MPDPHRDLKAIRKSYTPDDLAAKASILSVLMGLDLKHISGLTYARGYLRGNIENPIGAVQIPLGIAGPISVDGEHAKGYFYG